MVTLMNKNWVTCKERELLRIHLQEIRMHGLKSKKSVFYGNVTYICELDVFDV
jgi:hypothetical protein